MYATLGLLAATDDSVALPSVRTISSTNAARLPCGWMLLRTPMSVHSGLPMASHRIALCCPCPLRRGACGRLFVQCQRLPETRNLKHEGLSSRNHSGIGARTCRSTVEVSRWLRERTERIRNPDAICGRAAQSAKPLAQAVHSLSSSALLKCRRPRQCLFGYLARAATGAATTLTGQAPLD